METAPENDPLHPERIAETLKNAKFTAMYVGAPGCIIRQRAETVKALIAYFEQNEAAKDF
jgi:hypothetical protein